jgi:hypothetical protein
MDKIKSWFIIQAFTLSMFLTMTVERLNHYVDKKLKFFNDK